MAIYKEMVTDKQLHYYKYMCELLGQEADEETFAELSKYEASEQLDELVIMLQQD